MRFSARSIAYWASPRVCGHGASSLCRIRLCSMRYFLAVGALPHLLSRHCCQENGYGRRIRRLAFRHIQKHPGPMALGFMTGFAALHFHTGYTLSGHRTAFSSLGCSRQEHLSYERPSLYHKNRHLSRENDNKKGEIQSNSRRV
jgi:hypothetical protein